MVQKKILRDFPSTAYPSLRGKAISLWTQQPPGGGCTDRYEGLASSQLMANGSNLWPMEAIDVSPLRYVAMNCRIFMLIDFSEKLLKTVRGITPETALHHRSRVDGLAITLRGEDPHGRCYRLAPNHGKVGQREHPGAIKIFITNIFRTVLTDSVHHFRPRVRGSRSILDRR